MHTEPRRLARPVTTALGLTALAASFALLAAPAHAQLVPSRAGAVAAPAAAVAAVATPSCAGGIVYDDGTFEARIRFLDSNTGQGLEADGVMRFDLPASSVRIDQVCLCWARGENAPSTLDHGLVFFAADGPGGAPGTEIAVFDAVTNGIDETETIFTYDVGGLEVAGGAVYVGPRWNGRGGPDANGIFLCTDENGPGGQPMYAKEATDTAWLSFDELFVPPPADNVPPDAIGVRIDVSEVVSTCPQIPCVEDDDTLCLNGDRFAVDVAFDPPPPTDDDTLLEPGHAVELTDDTGYYWFFRDTNVEMVLKVLDGCGVNGHYWVFAGGLTNVQVEMEVCDTQEGIQRTYRNPQETTFQPIQDTAAFATCP